MKSNVSPKIFRRAQGNILGLILLLTTAACARSFRATPNPTKEITNIITFNGIKRSYILHIPKSYDGNHPTPIVLVFHGGGGNAENAARVTGFSALADEQNFIVVYPNGTGQLQDKLLTWNGGTCCGYAQKNNIDDVGFVHAIVADLQSFANIDTKRIYATGISNGGIMSYRLACEASDLIAAIGPVSGTQNIVLCEPREFVSVIHFHGTADQHLPYNGGIGDKSLAGVEFTSVQDSIQFWLGHDQCTTTPKSEEFADIQHNTYTCAQNTSVELYTIIGGKHAWPGGNGPAWPGGDQPTGSISATNLIWDFFAAHPKP